MTISITQANAAGAEKLSPRPRRFIMMQSLVLSACGWAVAIAWPWAGGNGFTSAKTVIPEPAVPGGAERAVTAHRTI